VRNSRLAWGGLSATNRERLSLAVLMAICRRFHGSLPPISVPELSVAVRLPAQIVNECINRIVGAGYVMAIQPTPGSPITDVVYQPAKPLGRITLHAFKSAADNLGANPSGDPLESIDPIVREFANATERAGNEGFFRKSVEELLNEETLAK
jgi:2,4-dienoyl-CoA reductase-like NADH-dependent reductase (Old Yellow Enzyme family)